MIDSDVLSDPLCRRRVDFHGRTVTVYENYIFLRSVEPLCRRRAELVETSMEFRRKILNFGVIFEQLRWRCVEVFEYRNFGDCQK